MRSGQIRVRWIGGVELEDLPQIAKSVLPLACENRSGALLVPLHFGDEFRERPELLLVPDALHELDLHLAPIEVALEVEQVNFKQGRAVVDGRTNAKAGDRRIGLPVDARDHRIDAVREAVGRLEDDIRRRYAQRAPKTLPGDDPA